MPSHGSLLGAGLGRSPRCRLRLGHLLLLGGPASGAAYAAGPSDDTAFIQHAIRRGASREPIQLRDLSREELAHAMRHLQGDLDLELPIGVSVPSSARVMLTHSGHDSYSMAEEEKPANTQDDFLRLFQVNNMAAKLCVAHFAAGYDLENATRHFLPEWTGVKPLEAAQQRAVDCQKEVDEAEKTLRFRFGDWWSEAWKFVDDRYGCTQANATLFDLAASMVPPRDAGGPKAILAHNKSGEAQDRPQQAYWGALDGEAAQLEEAHKLVQRFFSDVGGSPQTSSVAVLHHGRLFERYCGDCNMTRESRQPGQSMGKAVEGVVVAQRLDEAGSNMNIGVVVPELEGNGMSRGMTVHNLLNMVIARPARERDVRAVGEVVFDTANFAATDENRYPAGVGDFYYSTGNYHIVSRSLRYAFAGPAQNHSADLQYAEFAWTHLFNAIGAKSFLCERDMSGTILFGTSCWATTRDWAKIGLLMLNNGYGPDGERVVPEWMVADLFGDTEGHGQNSYYIHGWYRFDRLYRWRRCGPVLAAVGMGGNMVVVVPRIDLVVTRLSWRVGDGGGTAELLDSRNFGHGHMRELLVGLQC